MRERRTVRRACALGTAAAALTVTPASASVTGGGGFDGTAYLEAFPCGAPSCAATLSGSFVGVFAGTDSAGNPWTVTFPDPTLPVPASNLTADFDYSESCPVGATGQAAGTFTITGGEVNDGGVITHDGSIGGSFGWTRAAVGAAILLNGETVFGNAKTLGAQALPGAAVAAFVPEGTALCSSLTTLTVVIAGSALQPA